MTILFWNLLTFSEGTKSWKLFIHILGEPITSQIQSEINWPLKSSKCDLKILSNCNSVGKINKNILFQVIGFALIVKLHLHLLKFTIAPTPYLTVRGVQKITPFIPFWWNTKLSIKMIFHVAVIFVKIQVCN